DDTELSDGVARTPFDNDNNKYFVEATDHVLNYSDSWSSTEFTQIDHTGTINFLLNQEQPFADNYVVNDLYGLQDKTFYIEIWAGYRNCSYSRANGFFKLFTGLCYGGTINYQYGKIIMSCKIVDYTAILEDQLFVNSPFFDGMRDINAIDEILKMTGFRYKGVFDPGSLVNVLNNSPDVDNNSTYHHIDGRIFKFQKYALPSGYNRLDQPMFKFDMGTNFLDGIRQITKKSTKVFFFDQMGIAHYESIADLVKEDFLGKMPLEPLYKFTTNPEIFPGQMIFDKIEHNYTVEDVYNHIRIISNTPDFKPLFFDDLNWNAVENPDTEGFIGFLKFILALIFWFSCLSFPFYIFPESLRNIITLNPLFHIFEALRLSWIENNVLLSITSHPFSFLTIILGAIFLPLIGAIIFNKIYKKYGIVGY
ncbi:hypothetical protein LCGC14_2671360, partial [marine sediment metagenome]